LPFTGGATPSPERYGGGEGNSNVPLLQRVYESIAAGRGSAYDQVWPPSTAVGAENMALARAIAVNAPLSVRESLKLARLAQELSDGEMRERSRDAGRIVMTSEDAREGPLAFVQKRAPVWKGR
jgi:enoyl-CoA hydratase/carnithine racemase